MEEEAQIEKDLETDR